jgi:hypothetical protein
LTGQPALVVHNSDNTDDNAQSIVFKSDSSTGVVREHGAIDVINRSHTNGLASGDMAFRVADNGTMKTGLYIEFQTQKVGFQGITAPTFELSFLGTTGTTRTIGVERNTASNNPGANLQFKSGGATVGATNRDSGDLTLTTGESTGTGTGDIIFKAAPAGGSGTSDNTPTEMFRINGSGTLVVTGDLNPEADGTRDLGVQTTAQWANVWADLVNGADYAFLNSWRMLEAEKYLGYPEGLAFGNTHFTTGVVTEVMPEDAKPIFVVTEDWIEFQGVRLTKDDLLDLLSLIGR